MVVEHIVPKSLVLEIIYWHVRKYHLTWQQSIIITHKVCWQHRFFWHSLIIHPYWPSLLVNPLDTTQCLHTSDKSKFLQVGLWIGVHRGTLIMISSLLFQKNIFYLSYLVCKMRGLWHYSSFFVGCCFQDLFKIACSILVEFPPSFFSNCFIRDQVVKAHTIFYLYCKKLVGFINICVLHFEHLSY